MDREQQEGAGSRNVFVGVHDRQLDDKGRCALPPLFRAEIGDRCYLAFGAEGCVTLRTVEDFEEHARQLIEQEKRGEISVAHRRSVAANTMPVAVDKQGRLTVDERFRAHAGLAPGAPVVVAGMFDAVELWRPERFATIEAEGREQQITRQWQDAS